MIDNKTFQRYANDPAAFRDDLIVDVDGTARRFGEVQDDWQRADFAALDPALKRAAGRSTEPALMRAWLERGRGHSKTTDLAVTSCWLLSFATRPLRGYGFAADRDQSRLLLDAMQRLIRLNPWLSAILEVQAHKIANIGAAHPANGATLEIAASDVGSSYGILPDFIIGDEVTHWEANASDLFSSIISSAAKRATCLFVCIANAGFVDSWQWTIREAIRTDPAWHFSHLEGPRASWLTADRLQEQARLLPPVAYARLWGNYWSTGGGDALTEADIEAAFRDYLQPMTGREKDWQFVGGVDLGLTRDGSAVVVLGVPESGKGPGIIRLAHSKLWRPTSGAKIDLLEVERHIRELDEKYKLQGVAFDPWQMEHLAQRLEADSKRRRRNQRRGYGSEPWMREIPPTAANLREIAGLTIESFTDRRLQLFPCEPLRRDLLKLRAEEKSYGLRLTSPRDEHGHGDTFSAFSLALLLAHERAGKRKLVLGSIGSRSSRESRWEQRQAAYQSEMEMLGRGSGDDTQEKLNQILGGMRNRF